MLKRIQVELRDLGYRGEVPNITHGDVDILREYGGMIVLLDDQSQCHFYSSRPKTLKDFLEGMSPVSIPLLNLVDAR